MKVLVTGASGFVGRHLVGHLTRRGDEVVAVDREIDVTDATQLTSLMQEVCPDALVHLAALTHVGESFERPAEFQRVNVVGTRNVLVALAHANPEATALLVSSSDVYGAVEESELPLNESQPLRPLSPYAASKVEAEIAAKDVAALTGLAVVIARPFNHVGPGQSANFVVPAVMERLIAARAQESGSITVGDLSARRDFTDVRDVVRAYGELLDWGTPGEIYHVCSGVERSIRELVDQLVEMVYPECSLDVDPALLRRIEVPRARGSAEKILAATGWRPRIDLADSLRDALTWRLREESAFHQDR